MPRRRAASKLAVLACAAALVASLVHAQGSLRELFPGITEPRQSRPTAAAGTLAPAEGEFTFARLYYRPNPYRRSRGWGGREVWQTDWPDAEHHFLNGISRLTRIDAARRGAIVRPIDEAIFDYPFIYAVEVGHWSLTDDEAAMLREYLMRGGFLMVDDFHGPYEWADFMAYLRRVFPNRPIVDIPESDAAFHVVYDLDHRIQIPSRAYSFTGRTWEKGGVDPHWRGIYDDDGRLMVAINHNMDIGDAWEHADFPDYPENMTALAYRFGINYLVYAMTH